MSRARAGSRWLLAGLASLAGACALWGFLPSCAGPEPVCVKDVCEELDEAACEEEGCSPWYGEPWLEPGVQKFAGCRTPTDYGRGDCPAIEQSDTCAHPPYEQESCWTFDSGAIPDGWVRLSSVDACADFPQCGARP